MGAWKNILLMHQEGNKEASKIIANHYAQTKQYQQAAMIFSSIGDKKSADLMWRQLSDQSNNARTAGNGIDPILDLSVSNSEEDPESI